MSVRTSLARLSVEEFAAKVAERNATPGGGSVAAQSIALGAALTAMALRFTSGEKYAALQPVLEPRIAELASLQAEAIRLIDRDSESYDAVTAAYKLAKGTDAGKSARREAVQSALRGALEVPFRSMQIAIAVLRIGAESVESINPNLASDCATGALCAQSGLEGARWNVSINAKSIDDAAYVEKKLASARSMVQEARDLAARVQRGAETKLG